MSLSNTTEKTFDVINPFTQEVVGKAPNMDAEAIDRILKVAYKKKYSQNAEQRAAVLLRCAELIEQRKDECAHLIVQETGLSLKDARYEVGRVVNCAKFSAIVAKTIEADITSDFVLNDPVAQTKLKVITEPLDLVVAITPFNHPMNQVAHKIFPAIAAGTCVVLKPSEKTPLSAIKLVETLKEAGLEDGVLHVVTGFPVETITDRLLGSPLVDLVTFTGGLNVGKIIEAKMSSSGNGLKRYIPELGGCSSFIVCDDADLDLATDLIVNGCFKNSGQRCTSVRRVVIDQGVADELLDRVLSKVKDIKYGDPFDETTDMGTVISEDSAKEIEKRIDEAVSKGAKLMYGGKREGALLSPTVLDRVTLDMQLVAEETFGPVCPIIRVDSFDEALAVAQKTNYRLAGAIVTRDRTKALAASEALKVGQFNWNNVPGFRTEAAPFGGFGDSGTGEKEGVVMMARALRRTRTFYTH